MRTKFLPNFIQNMRMLNKTSKNNIGRWNINDNQAIKATLANMDSCGDDLCGKPLNYSINISNILDNEKNSKKKN